MPALGVGPSWPIAIMCSLKIAAPAEVPPTVTPAALARLLRLARKGRIAPGLDADLLLLDEGHAVKHVFAGGAVMVQDGRAVRLGKFERAAHTGELQ